jgi:3-oxoacyl-[acyl-carrier-protein] synthase-3
MVFRATDRDAGLVKAKVHTDGAGGKMLFLKAGGFLTRPYMKHEMIDRGEYVPRMDGREVFRYAVTKLPATARALLEETQTPIEQVDWFLAHQANKRINEYIREQLGVPEHKMPMNIDRYGNTSAATIPILVDELTRAGKLKKGELNMMLALGAGIHWGCALVRW